MISLVQVLITAVLVPVAFASSTSSAADPTPTHAAPAAATTCPVTRLPVSPDGRCGGGSGFGCKPGFCCSKHNYCGSTNEHCDVKSTVVMTVRNFLVHAIPLGSSKDTIDTRCQVWRKELMPDVGNQNVAQKMATADQIKITVTLAVSENMVCVIPLRVFKV
ncbi:hypothetical protein BASA50_002243 [Batrachochytrium salamandrivorans]|uniref:Chitin-binding type-1 domain-containing protein n=1 Tax=Batrachochytrium salamandrivorans TaxID=1357716 RepID=A0ABQ8FMC6_9FUNG|nr:hypothetical protein BASA50_002243 [Batrachochytrium salamandrivorans]